MRDIQPETGYTADEVKALLSAKPRQFVFADCYTIVASNGDTMRCTSAQKDMVVLPWGGGVKVTFTSKGLKVSGIRMTLAVGVDVDEQEVQWDFDTSIEFQGLALSQALLWGRFDGATIARDRYFAAAYGLGNTPTAWMGSCRLFHGNFGELKEVGRSYCKFTARSDLNRLEKNMPSELFQPGCRNAMYDAGCTLDRSLFQTAGTVGAGSTVDRINWTGATDVMKLGTIYVMTSSGVTLVRTIRDVINGVALLLSNPLEQTPDVGHDFVAYQGCDRSYTRCQALNNTQHYRGFLTVPTEETSL